MTSKVILFFLLLLVYLSYDNIKGTTSLISSLLAPYHQWRPASRFFLNSARKKILRRNRVKSLLRLRKPLLGDSFKPRLDLDRTPVATLILVLKARFWPSPCQKYDALRSLNQFDRNNYPRNLGCSDVRDLTRFLQSLSCSLSAEF